MYLSTNPIDANQFDPQPPLAGSSGTQTSSSTASATSSSPAATSTTATSDEEQHTVLVGAISGGAIGGFAVLCAIVFIVWRIKYNSKRSSKKHREDSELYNRTAQDRNHGYNGGEQEKMATAGAVLMHSPYQDSQSPVPPYSPQRSPQDWSPQMQQGFTQHPSIQGVETRSAFQAYSPQAVAHLPHRHQPQSPTLLSPPNDHAHFYNWGSSTALGLSQSEFGGPQFARSHHGPPQELAGDVAQSSVDVDARHIVDDHIDGSMVELPER